MSAYQQLTYEQRCQIEVLKKRGLSQTEIGKTIGVNQSTISRELRRNRGERGYRCKQAQEKAGERRRLAVQCYRMTPAMIECVETFIRQRWSPEQISGWLLQTEKLLISHERIYQHIWADKRRGGDLHKYLRSKGKKYQSRGSNGKTSRGQIKNRVSIDERPSVVDERVEAGHWEIDTVIGKNHSGALVTIVERVTQFTVSAGVKGKSAKEVTQATINLLKPLQALVSTITADNGKEFAFHEEIAEALGCQVYFAHPYHSWERGLNENTNGLLRQYYPKCTDFKLISKKHLAESIDQLNARPRKTLGYKTPADLMQEKLAAIAA